MVPGLTMINSANVGELLRFDGCSHSPVGPRIPARQLANSDTMPRDYAKNKSASSSKRGSSNSRGRKTASRKNSERRRIPSWLWLFTGVVSGAFIMFLLHLNGLTPTAPPESTPPPKAANENPTKTAAEQPNQQPEPRLQFYQLLKESEVEVPEASQQAQQQQPQQNLLYVLQAGSFRQATDANRLRAELILLNLQADIEEVALDNGDVWHRVVVGPFDSRSQMAKARGVLVSNDINPLLLKRADP